MSSTAGRQIGTVTRASVRSSDTFNDAETASNSWSNCLSAVVAVRWLTV